MATQIKLYTLRRLVIERDGEILDEFISLKTALLFVYLAMSPGKHSRDSLATLLWNETSNEQALKNLRTVLSSLRKSLSDVLEISRSDIALNPETDLWIDAQFFAEGCDAIRQEGYTPNLTDLEALADLYHEDFLTDVRIRQANAFEDWIYHIQVNLAQKYRQLLLYIADVCLQQRVYGTGVNYARKLVLLDPYWEFAQQRLMQLLAYTNQAHEALLQYDRYSGLLAEELDTQPEPKTTAIYEQIKAGQIRARATSTGLHAIVLPDMPYVDPVEDMDTAQRMLDKPDCRLLTLVGITGVGKTSLAVQIAHRRRKQYRHGTHIVPLASVKSSDEVASAILNALGVNTGSKDDTPEQQLIGYVKQREMLLVLDNYEHLLSNTDLIQQLLNNAPKLQLIITSQAQLNIRREWLLPVNGLRIPRDADEMTDAVQLFDLTARRNFPTFRLEDCRDEVVQICQLVDGLPLGIVIAAGWTRYLAPKEILSMLQKDLLGVKPVHEDMPVRHQGFQNLLQSMVAYLSEGETHALARLSIFKGSFDHNAALHIANIDQLEFIKLVDKSLVQRSENFRYTIHNVVRQLFQAQLVESGEIDDVMRQYTQYYANWCKDLLEHTPTLSDQLNAIYVEYHNITRTEHLSAEQKQRYILEIAPAMVTLWLSRNENIKSIISILRAGTLNVDIPSDIRASALNALAKIYLQMSDYDAVTVASEQALQLEKSLDMPIIRAIALRNLCEVSTILTDFDKAQHYLHEILAIESHVGTPVDPRLQLIFVAAYAQLGTISMERAEYDTARQYLQTAVHQSLDLGDEFRAAFGKNNLGIIALKEGKYDEAYNLFSEIVTVAKQTQDQTITMIFTSNLGEAAMSRGNYQHAIAIFVEALQIAVELDRRNSILNLMEQLAQLAIYLNRSEDAAKLLGFAFALREQLKIPVPPRDQGEHLERENLLREQLGMNYDLHWTNGQSMGISTAVMIALSLREA